MDIFASLSSRIINIPTTKPCSSSLRMARSPDTKLIISVDFNTSKNNAHQLNKSLVLMQQRKFLCEAGIKRNLPNEFTYLR